MTILVTGGAGYIGSHAVRRLLDGGHSVVVLDNLAVGHREAVVAAGKHSSNPADVPLLELDLRDTDAITDALKTHQVEAVMNFAALAQVGESVEQPLLYYANNTAGVISLLTAMDNAGVTKLVHSSTCATYGEPAEMPITETFPQSPINPYGWSKLFNERVFFDYAAANPQFAFAALRYFNVAGCQPDGTLGEDHTPESHLIPVLIQAALGTREKAYIFGTDYPTPDGTCVRDYIHVCDLVDAHAVVLDALQPGDTRTYNLGTGRGFSVKEIVDAVKQATGVDFTVELADRRPGDPPQLYANPDKIKRDLNWSATITDPTTMAQHAWAWFQAHPDGYSDD
ncbi:MAG: UDP-glucose 4-epimerase GalE [Planctomycetota bacterium]